MAFFVIKAVAILNHLSGIPEDADENVFVFGITAADLTTAAATAEAAVVGFYNDVEPGATREPAQYLSSAITRAALGCSVEATDITAHLDGSAAGPPADVLPWTLNAPFSSNSLPAECSVVITQFGTGRAAAPVLGPVSAIPNSAREQRDGAPATHSGRTRPKNSHTGRLYFGPLIAEVVDLTASGEAVVAASVSSDLAAAATGLLADAPGWSVWSRKLASVDPIIGGRIDNAFDTQRRRGVESTLRVSWP